MVRNYIQTECFCNKRYPHFKGVEKGDNALLLDYQLNRQEESVQFGCTFSPSENTCTITIIIPSGSFKFDYKSCVKFGRSMFHSFTILSAAALCQFAVNPSVATL